MAGKLQQVDRNGTHVLWGITDEGDYRVVAAYDKNFKDVTTQFANATPQAITKWSQQVDQKYSDGLQRKSTEIGNAFFAPYSTVTPAQAIAQLQREGIPGKLAESIVTNWAAQREVIGQNSLNYDPVTKTTNRLLTYEEYLRVTNPANKVVIKGNDDVPINYDVSNPDMIGTPTISIG